MTPSHAPLAIFDRQMEEAVGCAAEAFKTWREVPVQTRQRVMTDFAVAIRQNTDALAHSITLEQVRDYKGAHMMTLKRHRFGNTGGWR